MNLMSLFVYLSQVVEDNETALGHCDVHGVFGTYGDGCARVWQHNKILPRTWTFILNRVILHLHTETQIITNTTTFKIFDRVGTCLYAEVKKEAKFYLRLI